MKAYLLAALLLVSTSFAFEIQQEKETLLAPVESTNSVDFEISGGEGTIVLSLVGEKPWMLLTPTQFSLKQGDSVTVSLFVSPKSDTPMGLYRVRLTAEDTTTKEKKTSDLYISVEKESGVYIERILLSGDMEPTGTVKAEFRVKNFATSTINDIVLSGTVKGGNQMFELSERIGKIDPLKGIVVEKTFVLPEQSPAGEYVLEAKVSYQDAARSFESKFIVPERAVIKESPADYSSFVTGYKKSISVKNYGNKAGEYSVKQSVSNFDAVFYSGTEPSSATGNEYIWTGSLNPGETKTISYRVDYLPLILFLMAILIFSWYILVKLKTVRITKFIMQKRMIEEGAEFTIGLDVKNASGVNADDAVVRDFVPSVFDVKDSEGPKPAKKKMAHGTELEWKLGEMFRREERILSYKIVPVFGVHGRIALPTASVKFKLGHNLIENKSNVSAVGVEAEKAETLEDIFLKKKGNR